MNVRLWSFCYLPNCHKKEIVYFIYGCLVLNKFDLSTILEASLLLFYSSNTKKYTQSQNTEVKYPKTLKPKDLTMSYVRQPGFNCYEKKKQKKIVESGMKLTQNGPTGHDVRFKLKLVLSMNCFTL